MCAFWRLCVCRHIWILLCLISSHKGILKSYAMLMYAVSIPDPTFSCACFACACLFVCVCTHHLISVINPLFTFITVWNSTYSTSPRSWFAYYRINPVFFPWASGHKWIPCMCVLNPAFACTLSPGLFSCIYCCVHVQDVFWARRTPIF